MVTKQELAAQSQRLAAEEAEKQKEAEASRAAWLADWDARTEAWAKSLVNGALGAALTRWNRAGLRRIRLTQNRVWRADGGEVYGDPFRLSFSPDSDYGPTKTLLAHLRRAGFAAEVVAEEEQNVEWQHCGDGMGPVTVPGYHRCSEALARGSHVVSTRGRIAFLRASVLLGSVSLPTIKA